MSVLSRIAGLSRTIEFGYPRAVYELTRDREALDDARTAPEGSALRRNLGDTQSSFRQSQKLIVTWHRELAELGELVFKHLPETAARLRIVSPVTGTVDGKPGAVDALVQELRTIQAAALAADAGPVVTTPTATAPDQDLDDDAPPIPGNRRKWIKDLPPDDKGLRPAYRRDHVFRIWNETEGGFGAAKICVRWNELPDAHRKLISPRRSVKVTDVVAKRGLAVAKREHKKPPRKKRSRKTR